MADLSDNSYEWWAQVQALALKGYEQWSTATPLERLAMKQPYSKELEEGRFARLNSRAASMLLAALDSTVRADLVMRKSTQSATGILYRVLTLYQPGGENEKRLVLDQLQAPGACTDPTKAAKALRDWERWFRRAKDIGVTTPDATVLARALSNIMKAELENHPDAAFRTSLVKNELKLDTKPTNASVVAFHRHLLDGGRGFVDWHQGEDFDRGGVFYRHFKDSATGEAASVEGAQGWRRGRADADSQSQGHSEFVGYYLSEALSLVREVRLGLSEGRRVPF